MGRLTYKGLTYKTRDGRKVYSYDKFAPGEEYIPPSPTPTPTPSVTPSVTPSITPTISLTPTITPTSSGIPVTPSITPTLTSTPSPTVTSTETPTPTPSITPSHTPTLTPTPSSTPAVQYNILTELSDSIMTEDNNNLIIQDGGNSAYIDMSNILQGTNILVTNEETATTLIDAEVTQDTYTSSTSFTGIVNLQFSWDRLVSTDELYRINVYEDNGGVNGRLLDSSTPSESGTYTYTGNTGVRVSAIKLTSNGEVLNLTSSAGAAPFTYLSRTFNINTDRGQWGIDGITPWGSNQYHTAQITPVDPGQSPYKWIFVRTSLGTWTRYTYEFNSGTFINPQNISTGVSNYGASDVVTLVDNL